MAFMFLLPAILAITGIIIGFICFIGVCLIIIGITGIVMNKIYMKQMKTKDIVSKPLLNASSIILGIICILIPFGYILYGIIYSASQK